MGAKPLNDRRRRQGSGLLAGLAIFGLLVSAAPSFAADYRPPHTASGAPDLEGTWTNTSLTHLERPPEAKALILSDAEGAALEAVLAEKAARPSGDPVGQTASEWYDGVHFAKIDGHVRTSWIVKPADGKAPYTPDGRRLLSAARATVSAIGFENPEDRPLSERCLMASGGASGPPILNWQYASNYQIVQTAGQVVILSEMIHDARIIRLDASHTPSSVRPWMGDSIGHWEKDTLVVETTNFNPSEAFHVQLLVSPLTKVVERFTRISPTEIRYQFSVEDPKLYTEVWSGEAPLRAAKGPVYEYACHEGNYSLRGILAGARRQEADAAAKKLVPHN